MSLLLRAGAVASAVGRSKRQGLAAEVTANANGAVSATC